MGLFNRKKKESDCEAVEENAAPTKETSDVESQSERNAKKEESGQTPSAKQPKGAYFVSPHPDGGWQVKRANAKVALKRFDTKAEAEEYAERVAANQGTYVVRKKKDGKIQKKK